jgi:hypothetical protein
LRSVVWQKFTDVSDVLTASIIRAISDPLSVSGVPVRPTLDSDLWVTDTVVPTATVDCQCVPAYQINTFSYLVERHMNLISKMNVSQGQPEPAYLLFLPDIMTPTPNPTG